MTFSAPAAADSPAAIPVRPPAVAPENIGVVPGNAKVTILWSPVPGAEGYRIYRGVNGVWLHTPIGRTTATSHTSYGLENGTMYSFTVAAYTRAGNGPLSLAVNAMPLAPPQAVTMAAGDGRVTLNWQPSTGATSYTIYRRREGEPEFTELTTGVVAPPFVDPGLANGTRHYYQLRAVTAATQSELSAKVSAIPLPPAPASGPVLAAVAGNATVTLTWTAVNAAPKYLIYRSTTGAFDGPAIGSTTTTTFTNTGLVNDTTYFYTVAARNMGGEGPRASVAVAMPVAPPLAPRDVAAVAGNKHVALSWRSPDDAVAHNIYRGTASNRQAGVPVATAVHGSAFIDKNVVNGDRYFYRITAYNPSGESPRSFEVTATPEAPAAPMTRATLAAYGYCDARPAQGRGTFRRLWRMLLRRN